MHSIERVRTHGRRPTRTPHAALMVLVCMMAGGCKSRSQAVPEPAATEPAEAPAAAAQEPAALAEDDVRAFVEAWRGAQNRGDFAAYAASYAPDFRGVKRAGEREQRFDREGWLADREGMFSRPMTVEIADVDIRIDGLRAEVELTQTWTSGRFADTGRKRLVIAGESRRALLLVAEDMLSSRLLLAPEACVAALAPEHAGDDDDGPHVRSVTIVQPDTEALRFVCLVDVHEERGGAHVLGLLARQGRGWKVVGRTSSSYEEYQPEPPDDDEEIDPEVVTASAVASLALVAIAPGEQAVRLALSQTHSAMEMRRSTDSIHLYRVTEGGLESLLELSSRSSGNEVMSEDESQDFEVLTSTRTRGYHDLRVTTTRTVESNHDDEREHRVETEILRWTGTDYEAHAP